MMVPFPPAAMAPRTSTLLSLMAAAMLPLAALPLRAGLDPNLFPPAEMFRRLQLQTLNCGRDNTDAACTAARNQADSLIDHPRLPASCKDVLWSISRQAVPEASNSFERRDRIDRAAREVTIFCRQQAKPKPAEAPAPAAPGFGAGGFGFGSAPRP